MVSLTEMARWAYADRVISFTGRPPRPTQRWSVSTWPSTASSLHAQEDESQATVCMACPGTGLHHRHGGLRGRPLAGAQMPVVRAPDSPDRPTVRASVRQRQTRNTPMRKPSAKPPHARRCALSRSRRPNNRCCSRCIGCVQRTDSGCKNQA